jgi:peptidoglycan hydrolase-like protein with peptidoglycan-binding domain
LAKDGSFAGKPNGKWDASTVEATRKFQEAHGLNPSGKLDAKTLMQLGLGSPTAGVAAPAPSTTNSKLGNSSAQAVRRQ